MTLHHHRLVVSYMKNLGVVKEERVHHFTFFLFLSRIEECFGNEKSGDTKKRISMFLFLVDKISFLFNRTPFFLK